MNIFELMRKNGMGEYGGVSRQEIDVYQRELYKEGVANIPLDYARFLMEINGVQTDMVALFGLKRQGSFVRDIMEENSIAGSKSKNDLFLGDNFKEYLVYEWNKKSYTVINKTDATDKKYFAFLEEALFYFLQEYFTA